MDETPDPRARQVNLADSRELLSSLDDMTWWLLDSTCVGMGAERQFDYTMRGDLGADMTPRLGLSYELAVQSFVGWYKFSHRAQQVGVLSHSLPAPSVLVHGFWKHPDEPAGIDHAWVGLADGRIWEPITGLICNYVNFMAFGQCRVDAVYTETEARTNMVRYQHYGPWH